MSNAGVSSGMIAATLFSSFVVCFLVYLYSLWIFVVVANCLFKKKVSDLFQSLQTSSVLGKTFTNQQVVFCTLGSAWDERLKVYSCLLWLCILSCPVCGFFDYLVCMAAFKCLNFIKNLSLTYPWCLQCYIVVLYCNLFPQVSWICSPPASFISMPTTFLDFS